MPERTRKSYRFDGAAGEEAAAGFLSDRGFRILRRNWRAGRYEVDIIAEKERTLVFVEVKTRLIEGVTRPESAMTRKKFECLRRAAEAYLAGRESEHEVRFDLVSVDHDGEKPVSVRHIENAMSPLW